MWLLKDERKTLRKYYSCLPNLDTTGYFTHLSQRAYNATRNLIERGLIHEIKEGGEEHIEYLANYFAADEMDMKNFLSSPEDEFTENMCLEFTLKGYDLGRKYDSWWSRTGLWYSEYKGHWMWLIVAFLGGIISTLIVNWLSK